MLNFGLGLLVTAQMKETYFNIFLSFVERKSIQYLMTDNIIGISFVILHGIIDFDIFFTNVANICWYARAKQSIRNTTFLITN